MARVSFSAMVYEIVGKLGGSVFQYSYGGYQVHVRNSPRNPQTQYQQLRRGDFGFLAASWRNLSTIQRQTFIDAAVSTSAAFNLFVASNVNLILIEEPTITDYIPTTAPIVMPVDVITLEPDAFTIAASTGTTVVPAGNSLLIYSTNLKAPTKIFTNPSQYSPIKVFPAGTNIAAATSIKTEFNSRFGQITANQRLCIKAVLIDTTNGSRGVESFNCTTSEEMANCYTRIKTFTADADNTSSSFTSVNSYTLPANKLARDGDTVLIKMMVKFTTSSATNEVSPFWNASSLFALQPSAVREAVFEIMLVRKTSAILQYSMKVVMNNAVATADIFEFSGQDFTVTNDIVMKVKGDIAGAVSIVEETIDYIPGEL